MSEPTTFGGPVSDALERMIRREIQRHRVVVWLDREGAYTPFVDRLLRARDAGKLPYEVRAYRGSYLEVMLSLEGLTSGVDAPLLLLHLPGANEESVRHTPLYELYAVGTRFRRKLETAVRETAAGLVPLDEVEAYLRRDGLTLEHADAWLASKLHHPEGADASALDGLGPLQLVQRLLGTRAEPGSQSDPDELAGLLATPEGKAAISEHFTVTLGMPATWPDAMGLPGQGRRAEDLAHAAASWALCVEYVADLKRSPSSTLLHQTQELPAPLKEACQTLAAALREEAPVFYRRTADATEAHLPDEKKDAKAADLGKIDTFRFEEETVLRAALAALDAGEWKTATDWALLRLGKVRGAAASFWLREDVLPHRRWAWHLVLHAAKLGQAIAAAGPLGAANLQEAMARYQTAGAAVDRAHRLLEQARDRHLHVLQQEAETLRPRLDALRKRWRAWADGWAKEFNALCKEQGFLPPPRLQQRTLFDDLVAPAAAEGPTAYVLVDALRYELAEELFRAIDGTPGVTAHLDARFAELPTVTEVGMNVLAPVVRNGKLRPAVREDRGDILGFSAGGGFRVAEPDTRRRAMLDRVGKACPKLELRELLEEDAATLQRRVAQSTMIFVHSQEIDQAGESGAGLHVFDSAVSQLKAAWQKLWNAGVRHFVITADHGFLLHDSTSGTSQRYGKKTDPKRRHVFTYLAADEPGSVRVPLASLAYEVGASAHFLFPETTAVYETGQPVRGFVHGGNSLQERLIPVITVSHRTRPGSRTLQLEVRAETLPAVAGMHCLQASVEMMAQRELDFGRPKEVELALRVPGAGATQVELCDVRGDAKLQGGTIRAEVGGKFELFFRLWGPAETKERVELHHPGATIQVEPGGPDTRFAVDLLPSAQAEPVVREPATDWLSELEEGPREVFRVLQDHGSIGEADLNRILGGARRARRFAREIEALAARAPFDVRIETICGIKRYVREGGMG